MCFSLCLVFLKENNAKIVFFSHATTIIDSQSSQGLILVYFGVLKLVILCFAYFHSFGV